MIEELLVEVDPLEVFPATPRLDARVEAALIRERHRSRRTLGLVAALALAGLALAAISPAGRSAVASWLEVAGIRVERTDDLAGVGYRAGRPDLGQPVTNAQARARVPYRLRVLSPGLVGQPSGVFLRRGPPGGVVTFVYGPLEQPRLLFSQWRAEPYFFSKFVPLSVPIEHVVIGDGIGYWVAEAHGVRWLGSDGKEYRERLHLSAPALLWGSRGQGYRLEADVSRERAIELAASLQ